MEAGRPLLDLDIPDFSSISIMLEWMDARPIAHMERVIIKSVFMVVIWVLWTYRNALLFSSSKPRKDRLFDFIV